MTEGHKHKTVRIKKDGLVYRVVRKPLLHSRNLGWVDRSRFVFGPCARSKGSEPTCYTLSLLGVLHGLCGLTIFTGTDREWAEHKRGSWLG